jgi:hypothetical protein
VKYAGIQEFGGTIRHPGGTPYFVPQGGGQAVFVSLKDARARFLPRTKPHNIKIPERSFLRSALREMEPKIQSELAAAVGEVVHAS